MNQLVYYSGWTSKVNVSRAAPHGNVCSPSPRRCYPSGIGGSGSAVAPKLLTFSEGHRHTGMDSQQASDIRERLSRLWMQAEPAVNAYVFAAVQRFQDAEDVVQQVALAAARRFEEYDGSRPFVAWALWLAKSKIIDHYRVQGRQKVVFSETLLDQTAARLVERQAADHAGAAALERCIDKLPPKSRKLLDLRYVEDASMEAIARAIDSTAGSVRVMLFRIRDLLAECVKAALAEEAT